MEAPWWATEAEHFWALCALNSPESHAVAARQGLHRMYSGTFGHPDLSSYSVAYRDVASAEAEGVCIRWAARHLLQAKYGTALADTALVFMAGQAGNEVNWTLGTLHAGENSVIMHDRRASAWEESLELARLCLA